MAVLSVREKFDRRRSSSKDGKLSHVRVFLVTVDDPADGPGVALFADDGTNAVPRENVDTWPGNSFLRCVSVEAEPVSGSARHFEVTAEYETTTAEEQAEDPLSRPAKVSYSFQESTEAYFYDCSPAPDDWNAVENGPWKGKPVTTSAGDAFEDSFEREAHQLVITVVRNEVSYSPVVADAYSNTVNDADIVIDGTTYPAGTLKLSPICSTKQTERFNSGITVTYFETTYQFKAKADKWRDKPLDYGYNEYVPNADPSKPGKLRLIVGADSVPVKRPWPLDGKGRKKPKATDVGATLEFRPYREISWAPLLFAAA
ncbi:MAG: hypothetical protein QM754_07080 [Tepidisphaeraceae bacterium]